MGEKQRRLEHEPISRPKYLCRKSQGAKDGCRLRCRIPVQRIPSALGSGLPFSAFTKERDGVLLTVFTQREFFEPD